MLLLHDAKGHPLFATTHRGDPTDHKGAQRAMFELDHAKDQTMTVLKLALANLVMWTRDHYFPASYAQATWPRLAPLFQFPGRIEWGTDRVTVELRSFTDRRLTRDLAMLCQRVEAAQPRLLDGRSLSCGLPLPVAGE